MRNICIIGSGHIGLVTGACLAALGNSVICTDDDIVKIEMLTHDVLPFYEPGLEELIRRNVEDGRLSFTTSVAESARDAEIVFICVGTPQRAGGEADLSYVEAASKRVAETMDGYKLVVEKSTVPVRTGQWIRRTIELNNPTSTFDVVSNPEFLRQGKAIHDFMHPDRIVLGVESQRAADIMRDLYEPLHASIIVTNIETSEMIKHACNAFLAMKISYINVIARICEKVGADVVKVAEAMGCDKRIGREFLDAGVGYGGYCLPKDLAAFIELADALGCDTGLLKSVQEVNRTQPEFLVRKVKETLKNLKGKTVGVLGLSYKPDTDDMREAPAIPVIRKLQEEGVLIKAYDPQATSNAKAVLRDIQYCDTPYQVADSSDALIILTEWSKFRDLDLVQVKRLLRQPVIVDGRNMFDPTEMKRLGFTYQGVGR